MNKGASARRRTPAADDAGGNVVPFVRLEPKETNGPAPAVTLDSADRPAPELAPSPERRATLLALLFGSLLLHGGVLALIGERPEPQASVGIPAISVELVLGADTPAGVAETPSASETQEIAPTEEELALVETAPVGLAESETEARESETPQAAKPEPEPMPETVAEPAATPAEPAPMPAPRLEAHTEAIQQEPEPVRPAEPIAAEPAPRAKQPTRAASPSTPAASGVGRGSSSADANYHSRVAAHLARHKRFPVEAHATRSEGTARISFSIDGRGRVTQARLVRSSGAIVLDREAVAMAQRASPFPPPPHGRSMNFTVPVSFQIR